MMRTFSSSVVLAVVLIAGPFHAAPVQAQTATPAVIATFQIPGAGIVGISAGSNGDVAVYDRTPSAASSLLRFFVTTIVDGDLVVTEEPETVALYGDPPGFKGWMVRDAGKLYVLVRKNENTDTWGSSTYERMWLYIIVGKSSLTAIGYNKNAVVQGNEPVWAPEDYRYAVSGMAFKPSNAENGNNLRIIIDDTLKGNLDVLDFDAYGTSLAAQVRVSYRDRYENGCEWPDIDPGPWYTCSWLSNKGNGLALEWTLETRVEPTDPSLQLDDDIYILDPIYSQSKLRRIKVSHPGETFSSVPQTEIDLGTIDPFLLNGVESLHMAHTTDRLWMASGLQSFNEGWVPVHDTLNMIGQVIDPVFSDEENLMIDPMDDGHMIIPVADGFDNPTTDLILREMRDGVAVKSVTALTNFTKFSLDAAAYDPTYGVVYLAIDDTLWVVSVTTPYLPEIFVDDFESGNTSGWSSGS